MAEPDLQGKIDDAVKNGQYPDRKAAVAGLTKQLVDYQRGMLKDGLAGNPVDLVEKTREEWWKELLEQAGGDDGQAAQLYVAELRKIGGQ